MTDEIAIQQFKCANGDCTETISGCSTDQLMDRGWLVIRLVGSHKVHYSCVCPRHALKYQSEKVISATIADIFKHNVKRLEAAQKKEDKRIAKLPKGILPLSLGC